ncbi:MAG TPA: hypothetical protein VF595_05645, partial [Tepidisphaeraceae bacterium]
MRLFFLVLGVCCAMFGVSTPASAAVWIDFSGISPATLPKTINYSGGTVTVSATSSVFGGTPVLERYGLGVGIEGQESPTGGVRMGISNTSPGLNSWQIRLAFSQSQAITVRNIETYTNFEETLLQSDGVWTQVDTSPLLRVGGLGLNTLSLTGTNGPNGPFGYGHWSTTTTNLYMTYV